MAEPSGAGDLAKRDRILRAALEVCGKQGVAGARMEEVAARAGVSKGTLYRFFESKEDLFLATMLASYEEGLRLVDPGRETSGDLRARLDAYLEGLTKVLATVGPRMNVQYQAWGLVAGDAGFQERLHRFLQDFHRDRDAEIQALIREGQRAGIIRRDLDGAALTHGVSALLSGFLYRATFDPGSASPEALRACFEAMVREPLFGGAAPDGAGDA